MNHFNKFLNFSLILSDLKEIDYNLSQPKADANGMVWIILLKQALISIANLVDEEKTIKSIYKENAFLSEKYKINRDKFEFAKYLRNKFAGHISYDLIEKTIEWRPDIRIYIKKPLDQEIMYFVNLFILETAINTYVSNEGEHKLFDSETDLIYPPDMQRFLILLTETIRSAIDYTSNIVDIFDIKEELDWEDKLLEYAKKAAKTEFKYLKKS